MSYPHYTKRDLEYLVQLLKGTSYRSYIHVLLNEAKHVRSPEEHIRILESYDRDHGPVTGVSIYRRFLNVMFKEPFDEMPLFLNSEFSVVAKWRLKICK